jgi:hypoxanthine phosphoribosyltransferase
MSSSKAKVVFFSAQEIGARVAHLGAQITADYADKELVLICALKGSIHFFSDLSRSINLPVRHDFVSMGKMPQSGLVHITKDLEFDIEGKHVILVEDIVRTGLTTGHLIQNLQARNPASIVVCTLLVNFDQQLIHIPVAYFGFEISEVRVIGYGLDVNEKGRNLPYIAEIDRSGNIIAL